MKQLEQAIQLPLNTSALEKVASIPPLVRYSHHFRKCLFRNVVLEDVQQSKSKKAINEWIQLNNAPVDPEKTIKSSGSDSQPEHQQPPETTADSDNIVETTIIRPRGRRRAESPKIDRSLPISGKNSVNFVIHEWNKSKMDRALYDEVSKLFVMGFDKAMEHAINCMLKCQPSDVKQVDFRHNNVIGLTVQEGKSPPEVISAIIYRIQNDRQGAKSMEILLFVVHPDRRQLGLGRLMHSVIWEIACKTCCTEILLSSLQDSESFYKKLNYFAGSSRIPVYRPQNSKFLQLQIGLNDREEKPYLDVLHSFARCRPPKSANFNLRYGNEKWNWAASQYLKRDIPHDEEFDIEEIANDVQGALKRAKYA